MSEPSNITEFKQQLAEVMVKLHNAMPAPISITTEDMSEDGIKWAGRAGLIQGTKYASLSRFSLNGATLTPRSLSLLQQIEGNVSGRISLGEFVGHVLSDPNHLQKQRAVDLLAKRLLDI